MLESVKEQIEKIKKVRTVESLEKPDGSVQVLVKEMPTYGNLRIADVMTVLPVGYPQTIPSGFSIWNNNTWNNVCFRPNTWDPAKDTLWKWIKMIERFFKENPQ